jgi:hypothetical protein
MARFWKEPTGNAIRISWTSSVRGNCACHSDQNARRAAMRRNVRALGPWSTRVSSLARPPIPALAVAQGLVINESNEADVPASDTRLAPPAT